MLTYTFKIITKFLRFGYIPSSGRNFSGVICIRHKGGSHMKKSYFIDFFRRINLFGFVSKIIKSINFTGFLGLIIYQNGLSCYNLLSEHMKIGDKIYSGYV